MSFVDAVAEAMWRADDDAVQSSWGFVNMRERGRYKHMAEAAIAVCRPRVVSMEQVDELPYGSIVRGGNGHAYEKQLQWTMVGRRWLEAGNSVVLWTPETGEQ